MVLEFLDPAFNNPLAQAVIRNDKSALREALKEGFPVNFSDCDVRWTAIHVAASDDKKIRCLKILCSNRSANLNYQTHIGETPLFIACENECVKTVTFLVRSKCNVNIGNSEGETPLHVACRKRNFKIIKLLLKRGAWVNTQDFNGYTPLHETVASGCRTRDCEDEVSLIVSYLLARRADSDLLEHEGNYPFHFACQNGILKSVDLLLNASKQHDVVNFCDKYRCSPFMKAVSSENVELMEYLLSKGANANLADIFNYTALHIAAQTGNFEIFSKVLQVTSDECISKYCIFNEERDFKQLFETKRINSLICLAIDVEDLQFLTNVLESGIHCAALQCPVFRFENHVDKTFTLHSPISFLLESKMNDLGDRTVDFLSTLISYNSPLKMTSSLSCNVIYYLDPICAALISLNDCDVQVVMKSLQFLIQNGTDTDYSIGGMPFSMKIACEESCKEVVLLLLQYSNVLEPEDILNWIDHDTSSNQEIIKTLLPLAPYYTRCTRFPANQVYSLTNYCRCVIRKQLHEELEMEPTLFKSKLSDLPLPKCLIKYLSYM